MSRVRAAVVAVLVTLTMAGMGGAATRRAAEGRSTLTLIRLTLALSCIHSYEGAWDANTGNGYHGGLQMDARFEQTYGAAELRRWGHAENWAPAVQIAVAIRAERTRGFTPWPTSSKRCGLT